MNLKIMRIAKMRDFKIGINSCFGIVFFSPVHDTGSEPPPPYRVFGKKPSSVVFFARVSFLVSGKP
jgi:hypothetical protein